MRHTISALMENKFGVLARIAGLFSARGFNIQSLAVGQTEDPEISRMTVVVDAPDERILEQIKKQLHKLIDVVTVEDLTKKEHVEKELILVKVGYSAKVRPKLNQLLEKYSARLLHHKADTALIEAVGGNQEIKELLGKLDNFGIKELVRTGNIATLK